MLSRIVVDAFAGSALSFIAIQGGATWTEGVGGAITPANLLGWAHVAPGDVGSDIMGAIGAGAGAIGFAAPLGPGVCSRKPVRSPSLTTYASKPGPSPSPQPSR